MNELTKNQLWEEYSKNKTLEIRDKIIIEYAPLVKFVAGRLNMYLGYNVEYDDLVSYGIFGLIDAIDKFDYDKGVKFETYASLRIRGAILDEIRKLDWIPRSLRQKQKKIETAYQKMENIYGSYVTDEHMSDELGISVEEYQLWQNQTKIFNIISLEEFMEQGTEGKVEQASNITFNTPEQVLETSELKRILRETLDNLTEKERKVILLYYYEDLTLKEISCILEVSESRVSQLHTKALQKMRGRLGNNIDLLASIF